METSKGRCHRCRKRPGTYEYLPLFLCAQCSSVYKVVGHLENNLYPSNITKKKTDNSQIATQPKVASSATPLRATRLKTKKSKSSLLEQYGKDFTKLASKNLFDPLIGRDKEIERVVRILNRRTKNNPVIVGDPGIGKTAIVEGLAKRVASKEVPSNLRNLSIISIDVASLLAGTRYRGDFEERLNGIMEEATKKDNVLLFIDEIHNLMGAGSSSNNKMDAANILKPYLSRGQIQLIGATTFEEYRMIEQDTAFERRFQPVKMEEPNTKEAIKILNGIKHKYEIFHNVSYSAESIESCVKLSEKYISHRKLPDKAIDLLDEVGSRASLKRPNQTNTLESEINLLHDKQLLNSEKVKDHPAAANNRTERIKKEIILANERNKRLDITASDMESIVEEMTGIAIDKMDQDDRQLLSNLHDSLSSSIIGQPNAIDAVVKSVKRNRLNIRNLSKPSVMLFVGPTGVGKTELTKCLAKHVYGSEKSIIRFDMSEYMEANSSNKLIGSPPGYVGHDQPGQLTEKVRNNPYSIILLDEVEKAHPMVLNMFLQAFDEGKMKDSNGNIINFSHSTFIMTSNLGAGTSLKISFNSTERDERFKNHEAIASAFTPEFRNRIDEIVPFEKLTQDSVIVILEQIITKIQLGLENKGFSLSVSKEAKSWLASMGYDEHMGARMLSRVTTRELEDKIIDYLLNNTSDHICVEYDQSLDALTLNGN